MPGTNEAIAVAAQRGWEAVVLVIIMLGLLGFFLFLGRWFINSMDNRRKEDVAREERTAKDACEREARLTARVVALEMFVENTLIKMIIDNGTLMTKMIGAVDMLTVAMQSKPCLLSSEHQNVVVDRISDKVAEQMAEAFRKPE